MKQAQALSVMLSGGNVFLTGPPGAGKTYVLKQFIDRVGRSGKTVAITASTGIAATHIGGTTIHSWSGLGIRDDLSEWDKSMMAQTAMLTKRYNSTDILVVDEVSMLHGKRLGMVGEIAKMLRSDLRPFGGMQVILVGDLFQLPPVNRSEDSLDFVHTSLAWQELNLSICYLTEQHRQRGEDGLLDILEAMRAGELEVEHQEKLQSRIGKQPIKGTVVTRLYSHNIDVDSINNRHLQALSTETHSYLMNTKGRRSVVDSLTRSILAPVELLLKIGAEVMFVANDFTAGFVNGSRGQVIKFDKDVPIVQLHSGRIIAVQPHSWNVTEDGKIRAEAVQLPLRLAWAITIHKSQGMSLDAAEIDLSKSFTPGMGYVALSRVRSLEGIYLAGINRMALQLHPDIFEFDRELASASAKLAAQTEDVDNEVIMPKAEVSYDQELFEKLRIWRLGQARTQSIAPFMVAHDSTLVDLAVRKPSNIQQLQGIKGIGLRKIEIYGRDIIDLIALHAGDHEPLIAEWNQADDTRLIDLMKTELSLEKVAELLQRSPNEVWQRISQLL